MLGFGRRGKLDKSQVEAMLSQALVPVQPSTRFLRRLRARLVTYSGDRKFSGWMVVVFLATVLLLAVTLIGLLIRLIAAGIKLIGVIIRKRREPVETSSISL